MEINHKFAGRRTRPLGDAIDRNDYVRLRKIGRGAAAWQAVGSYLKMARRPLLALAEMTR